MAVVSLALRRDPLDVLAALAAEPGAVLFPVPDPVRPVTIVGCRPVDELRFDDGAGDAIAAVSDYVARHPPLDLALPFPLAGGLVGYLAYEAGRAVAPRASRHACPVPLAVMRRYPQLRRLLEVNPADAWAWRELALTLVDEWPDAGRARGRAGSNPGRAQLFRGLFGPGPDPGAGGAPGRGPRHYREALRLEVDNDFALYHFVNTAPSLAERQQALEVVAEELRRQVIFRDALFAYQSAARGVLPPRDVLKLLQEAHRARPDLWQAWSVLIHQLVDIGDHDQALQVAREGTGRFPLLAPLWIDLARVQQARLDDPAQIAALRKALELNPKDAFASRQLAVIYQRQHQLADARDTLEQAIVANPLDAMNHGSLANVLWQLGERDRAIERARRILIQTVARAIITTVVGRWRTRSIVAALRK